VDGSYRFFIELMRRWVAKNKRFPEVREELDRLVPEADELFIAGRGHYRLRDLRKAIYQLRQALTLNPHHLEARLLLGEALSEQQSFDKAVRELEYAYEYSPDIARSKLSQALERYGDKLEEEGQFIKALKAYGRILEISPGKTPVSERIAGIAQEGVGQQLRRKVVLMGFAGLVAVSLLIGLVLVIQRGRRAEILNDYQTRLTEMKSLVTKSASDQATVLGDAWVEVTRMAARQANQATQEAVALSVQTQVAKTYHSVVAEVTQTAVAIETAQLATKLTQTAIAEPTQTEVVRLATRSAIMEAVHSSGQSLLTIPAQRTSIEAIAYSPDGERLAIGFADGGIVLGE
jgi:tetratricopeptide (TPR) repeat protein